jgi:Uncharacterized protein conserved in bacteria (DUF2255)
MASGGPPRSRVQACWSWAEPWRSTSRTAVFWVICWGSLASTCARSASPWPAVSGGGSPLRRGAIAAVCSSGDFAADEMQLASLGPDRTLRKPVTIWVVRLGEDLCVRSYKGRTAARFRGTQVRREGHIKAGGVDKVVLFVCLRRHQWPTRRAELSQIPPLRRPDGKRPRAIRDDQTRAALAKLLAHHRVSEDGAATLPRTCRKSI